MTPEQTAKTAAAARAVVLALASADTARTLAPFLTAQTAQALVELCHATGEHALAALVEAEHQEANNSEAAPTIAIRDLDFTTDWTVGRVKRQD